VSGQLRTHGEQNAGPKAVVHLKRWSVELPHPKAQLHWGLSPAASGEECVCLLGFQLNAGPNTTLTRQWRLMVARHWSNTWAP